jgi:hypothetical protein
MNAYIYARNNPVNLADAWGLAPGDLFSNPRDAAVDAIDYSFARKDRGVEHGGWVYEKNGKYTYDEPFSGSRNRVDIPYPYSATDAAWYHTHTPGLMDEFSADDIDISGLSGKEGYLGMPNGKILVFDPATGETKVVRCP